MPLPITLQVSTVSHEAFDVTKATDLPTDPTFSINSLVQGEVAAHGSRRIIGLFGAVIMGVVMTVWTVFHNLTIRHCKNELLFTKSYASNDS